MLTQSDYLRCSLRGQAREKLSSTTRHDVRWVTSLHFSSFATRLSWSRFELLSWRTRYGANQVDQLSFTSHIASAVRDITGLLIDEEALWHLADAKLRVVRGYALVCRRGERPYPLHQQVLKKYTGLISDHIDGNRLDNRIANLRPISIAHSNQNRWHGKEDRGVSPSGTGWRASVQVHYHRRTWQFQKYSDACIHAECMRRLLMPFASRVDIETLFGHEPDLALFEVEPKPCCSEADGVLEAKNRFPKARSKCGMHDRLIPLFRKPDSEPGWRAFDGRMIA
jgi:hypothetical protein